MTVWAIKLDDGGTGSIHTIRAALKHLGRKWGLRCIEIRQLPAGEPKPSTTTDGA